MNKRELAAKRKRDLKLIGKVKKLSKPPVLPPNKVIPDKKKKLNKEVLRDKNSHENYLEDSEC